MQQYSHMFLKDILVQGNQKLLIIVCVISVNRYGDNYVHPC